ADHLYVRGDLGCQAARRCCDHFDGVRAGRGARGHRHLERHDLGSPAADGSERGGGGLDAPAAWRGGGDLTADRAVAAVVPHCLDGDGLPRPGDGAHYVHAEWWCSPLLAQELELGERRGRLAGVRRDLEAIKPIPAWRGDLVRLGLESPRECLVPALGDDGPNLPLERTFYNPAPPVPS